MYTPDTFVLSTQEDDEWIYYTNCEDIGEAMAAMSDLMPLLRPLKIEYTFPNGEVQERIIGATTQKGSLQWL